MGRQRPYLAIVLAAVGVAGLYRGALKPRMYTWGARPDEIDLLERAVGAHMHNANEIHPEWQDVRVGDTIGLARRYGSLGRQVIADVEVNSHLVMMSADDFDRVRRGGKASGAWGFHLRPENGRTRLVARGSGGAVGHLTFDVPHFVMEEKMLRGIRDRAERNTTARCSSSIANTDME